MPIAVLFPMPPMFITFTLVKSPLKTYILFVHFNKSFQLFNEFLKKKCQETSPFQFM